jgi:hypothetical protein
MIIKGDQVQRNGKDYKPSGPVLTVTEVENHRTLDGNIMKKSGEKRIELSDGTWEFPWNLTPKTQGE